MREIDGGALLEEVLAPSEDGGGQRVAPPRKQKAGGANDQAVRISG